VIDWIAENGKAQRLLHHASVAATAMDTTPAAMNTTPAAMNTTPAATG
jgi:hypothetical protein